MQRLLHRCRCRSHRGALCHHDVAGRERVRQSVSHDLQVAERHARLRGQRSGRRAGTLFAGRRRASARQQPGGALRPRHRRSRTRTASGHHANRPAAGRASRGERAGERGRLRSSRSLRRRFDGRAPATRRREDQPRRGARGVIDLRRAGGVRLRRRRRPLRRGLGRARPRRARAGARRHVARQQGALPADGIHPARRPP